jgi:hypothetical protein
MDYLSVPSTASVKHLRQLFVNLESLTSLWMSGRSDLFTLLPLLPRPDKLQELTLDGCLTRPPSLARNGAEAEAIFSKSISIFTSLTSFSLLSDYEVDADNFCAFPSLPTALAAFPLRSLTLDVDVLISSADLLSALDDFPRTLETLTLHFFDGRYGSASRHFELPQWREDFTYKGMRQVVRTARKKGIRVDGTVLNALEVHEAYDAPSRCR